MITDQIRLVAFDLDGTLLRGETVCEVLARPLGRLKRMRELENLAPTDRAGVRSARQEMASWYKGVSKARLCSHLVNAHLAPGAHEGTSLLRSAGIKTAIVSITWEFAVEWFARHLGVDFYVGTKLSQDGQITHFWPEDKPVWLTKLTRRLGYSLRKVVGVGDSTGDLYMLKAVGFAFFIGATLPDAMQTATHIPEADISHLARLMLRT